MNEICRINNSDIDKISLCFCAQCKSILNKISKKCDKCLKIFCDLCIKDNNCPKCRHGELKDTLTPDFEEIKDLLFCCNKSIKCTQKYTYEEKLKNHSHKNPENINCPKCQKNLNQETNCLKCYKCQNYFCYKIVE